MTTADAEARPEPAEHGAYRDKAYSWLSDHAELKGDDDPWAVNAMQSDEDSQDYFDRGVAWQKALFEGGYAGIAWPAAYGGGGGESWMTRIFNEEAAKFDAGSGFINSTIAMLGPTLLRHGTEEQKLHYLPRLLSGEYAFCQLFSEPGAGSDLAGLACRAERDGDQFIVNGQKVWNSAAQHCNWGFILTRTDPTVPKHQGITFFLVDMDTPGIEVRPLVQMTGAAHFNEVFLTDVAIPGENMVGELNAGWGPARTVMANEAAFIGGGSSSISTSTKLIELARSHGNIDNVHIRHGIADVYTRELLLKLMGEQIQQAVRRGEAPPIDGGLIKLYVALNKVISGNLAMTITQMAGTATSEPMTKWAQAELMNRYSISIGGGTNEVQRNNLAERALGLPREPRVDKDVAFTDIPRS